MSCHTGEHVSRCSLSPHGEVQFFLVNRHIPLLDAVLVDLGLSILPTNHHALIPTSLSGSPVSSFSSNHSSRERHLLLPGGELVLLCTVRRAYGPLAATTQGTETELSPFLVARKHALISLEPGARLRVYSTLRPW